MQSTEITLNEPTGPVPFDVELPDDPLLWPGLYFVADRDHVS